MAFAGLSNWFKKRVDGIYDAVSANTPADQQRRLQAGQPAMYGDQQKQNAFDSAAFRQNYNRQSQTALGSPVGNATAYNVPLPKPQELYAGDALLQDTSKAYSFTPQFKQTVQDLHPSIVDTLPKAAMLGNRQPGGVAYPIEQKVFSNIRQAARPNGVPTPKPYAQDVLVHEGLHGAYDKNPNARASFAQAYKQVNDPMLTQYLNDRLSGYGNYPGLTSLKNFDSLPDNIKSEVHSYIPQYYTLRPATQPQALSNYYQNYIDVNKLRERRVLGEQLRSRVESFGLPDGGY